MITDKLQAIHNDFLVRLKGRIVKKRAFGGSIYELHPPLNDLEEYASVLCQDYQRADEQTRLELRQLVSDPAEVWFFYQFAGRLAQKLRMPTDCDSLELGLLSLSLVGDHMDFRDVSMFLHSLYESAIEAHIPEVPKCFASVGALSCDNQQHTNVGFTSVSKMIGSYPRRAQAWEQGIRGEGV